MMYMECLLYSRNFDDLKNLFVSNTIQKKFEGTKEESEAINRRSDNTMAKKRRHIMIYKKLQRKLKIEQHERNPTQVFRNGKPGHCDNCKT
jgi:D-hexose-6-phosphate mutarotase